MTLLTPRAHQLAIAKRLQVGSLLVSLAAGGGKTGAAAIALKPYLNSELPILLIAPYAVLMHGWARELPAFGIDTPITSIAGLSPAKRIEILQSGNYKILGITWTLLFWLAVYAAQNNLKFEVIIADESSAAKNAKTKTAKALVALADHANKIWLLSATPMGNGHQDLWPSMRAITKGDAFWGKNFHAWQNRHFIGDPHRYYRWWPRPGAVKLIEAEAQKHTISMSLRDCTDVPLETHTDYIFDLSPQEQKLYDQFAATGKIVVNGQTIEVRDELARLQGLATIPSGFIYDSTGAALHIGDTKALAFADIYAEQGGRPTMVIVRHRHDLELLRKIEPKLQAITGATPMTERPKILDAWNGNGIKLLALSAQAAGHGLNAQHSDCQLQVHFSLNWSSELYTQVVARLVRTNQTNKITVLRMVANGTIDEFVVKAIENKTLTQQQLLDATRILCNQ